MKYESIFKLSPSELEVFKLVGDEKGNKEIAKYLFKSVNTIRIHIKSIYEKLGFKNQPQNHIPRVRLILLSQRAFKENVIDIKEWNLIKKVIELEERIEILEKK